jgi:hypothetical protein
VKQQKHKSLFASFSSEKEESSFFEKKEAKKLLILRCGDVRVAGTGGCPAGQGSLV